MARRKQAWTGWGSPMHRVAGWDFDHRLNGYITTAADRFSCDCGEEFPTPSGYRKCGSCGRAWNSYVIGSGGTGKEASLEKVIVREIPVRKDVIVASKRRRQAKGDCECWDGYERVPGTKPCAPGSCRKKAARRYVAWCRQVDRLPNSRGFRHFLTAEKMVRLAGPGGRVPPDGAKKYPEADPVFLEKLPWVDFEHGHYWKGDNVIPGPDFSDEYSPGWRDRPPQPPYEAEWDGYGRGAPGWVNKNRFQQWDEQSKKFVETRPKPNWKHIRSDDGQWGYTDVNAPVPYEGWRQTARRYAAWCREVGRVPSNSGFRRFLTAEKMVRIAREEEQYGPPGKQLHLSPGANGMPSQWAGQSYPGLREQDEQFQDGWNEQAKDQAARANQLPLPPTNRGQLHPVWPTMGYRPEMLDEWASEHPHLDNATYNDLAEFSHSITLGDGREGYDFGNPKAFQQFKRNQAAGKIWGPDGYYGNPRMTEEYPGYHPMTGDRVQGKRADRHELRRKDLAELEAEQADQDEVSIHHFSRRRRAELFSVTDEGETPKGEGKDPNTPKMRKNPARWTEHKQNGQYSKRWN